MVREAALHDVDAVVRAGPDLGDALAGGAARHLGQGDHALVLGVDLKGNVALNSRNSGQCNSQQKKQFSSRQQKKRDEMQITSF